MPADLLIIRPQPLPFWKVLGWNALGMFLLIGSFLVYGIYCIEIPFEDPRLGNLYNGMLMIYLVTVIMSTVLTYISVRIDALLEWRADSEGIHVSKIYTSKPPKYIKLLPWEEIHRFYFNKGKIVVFSHQFWLPSYFIRMCSKEDYEKLVAYWRAVRKEDK